MDELISLKAIAREMQSGVVVINGSGVVRYANPFLLKMFSSEKDLKGTAISSVVTDSALIGSVDAFIRDGEVPAPEIDIRHGDKVFGVRMVSLKEGGENGLVLFLKDITEEKRVEAIKRDFVANVSHELRTPLASIKGYSETLLDGALDERETLEEFLRVIDKQATRMSRLIDDLLVLSRLESQQMPIVGGTLDMVEFAEAAVGGFKKHAVDKGIELTFNSDDNVPVVTGDRDRIEQVLVNLLDNAIKYTPSGGKVTVTVDHVNGKVRTRIKDTGIGIPLEDIPRIFERFYRVDKARSRDLGGTGLGLAIVKHIVQGLNGRVDVKSKLGKGTTFSFYLLHIQDRVSV